MTILNTVAVAVAIVHSDMATPAWSQLVPSVCFTSARSTWFVDFGDRGLGRRRHLRFDTADATERNLDAENLGKQRLGFAPAQVIHAREQHDQRP